MMGQISVGQLDVFINSWVVDVNKFKFIGRIFDVFIFFCKMRFIVIYVICVMFIVVLLYNMIFVDNSVFKIIVQIVFGFFVSVYQDFCVVDVIVGKLQVFIIMCFNVI